MLPILALVASLTAASAEEDVRMSYELKCLFCHSAEEAERPRLRPEQWRRLVEDMRRRAPLLISRRDVDVLTRYIVKDLKLVPAGTPPRRPRAPRLASADVHPPAAAEPRPEPVPQPAAQPLPEEQPADVSPPVPLAAEDEAWDEEAERLGPALLQTKCSKCHTLRRVFLKVDSLDRGKALVERMRKKTGSGITREQADLLIRLLRSRL